MCMCSNAPGPSDPLSVAIPGVSEQMYVPHERVSSSLGLVCTLASVLTLIAVMRFEGVDSFFLRAPWTFPPQLPSPLRPWAP